MVVFKNTKQLNRESLYEQIADSMEEQIISSPELIGQQLPSEQHIADQFNVSRNVAREAFKVLKERGFISGRNGVCYCITKPDSSKVGKAVARFVQTDSSAVKDVFEVRYALELSAVVIAAERASQQALKECEKCIDSMKENKHDAFLWAHYDYLFHRKIVESTDNSLFLSLYESVSIPLKTLFEKAWGNKKAVEDGIKYHKAILSLLKKRDSEKAYELMKEHLNQSQREMEIYFN